MNIAEILRGLADKIDGASQEIPHQDQSAQLHKADAVNDENPDVNTDSMVSPLQQKLELLKKAAGVENAYDDEGACDQCGSSECECDAAEQDPLEQMKKMAGLQTVMVASEDNDIEG